MFIQNFIRCRDFRCFHMQTQNHMYQIFLLWNIYVQLKASLRLYIAIKLSCDDFPLLKYATNSMNLSLSLYTPFAFISIYIFFLQGQTTLHTHTYNIQMLACVRVNYHIYIDACKRVCNLYLSVYLQYTEISICTLLPFQTQFARLKVTVPAFISNAYRRIA